MRLRHQPVRPSPSGLPLCFDLCPPRRQVPLHREPFGCQTRLFALIRQKRLMLCVQEEERRQDARLSSAFSLQTVIEPEMEKTRCCSDHKAGSSALNCCRKGIICNHGHRGKRGTRRRSERGSVMGILQDGSQGVGSFWHPLKVGVSTAPPPGGRGKVYVCYLDQT